MKLNLRIIRNTLLSLILTLFLLSVVWVLIYRWLPPPATLHMFTRRAKAGQENLADNKIKYQFVSLDEVSAQMPLALIAAEDQLFIKHNGFDFKALEGAYKSNQKNKGKTTQKSKPRVIGGSTISQQVAKNVFLWHGRSYVRKGVEAYFTVLIELLWSKSRIMEVYLNIAEMGDRIFGIQAASQIYFNKTSDKLTAKQAALIASVLPNPIKYSVKNPSAAILRKRRRVELNMKRLGGLKHVAPLLKKSL